MSRLKTLIRMELDSTLPLPTLELFFAVLVASGLFLFGTGGFNTTLYGGIDVRQPAVTSSLFAVTLLRDSIGNVFLFNAIAVFMLVSLSIGGNFSTGYLETVLSYPVRRIEYLGSKTILFTNISFVGMAFAIVIGMSLSPFNYSVAQIGYAVIIVFAKSIFVVSLAALVATVLAKTAQSAMLLLFLWFVLLLFRSSIPTPYAYLLFSEDALLAQDAWVGYLWGVLGPIIASIIFTLLLTLYFTRLDILRGRI